MVQMGNRESWLVSHLSEVLRWYGVKIGPVKMIILAMMESNLTHPLPLGSAEDVLQNLGKTFCI